MMRERLVGLIKESLIMHIEKSCLLAENIADDLIANGVVVLPCKVGDEVFYLHEVCDENDDEYLDISAGKCEGISMQKDGLWMFCRYEDGLTFWHKSDKTVFLNREDAERALKGEAK